MKHKFSVSLTLALIVAMLVTAVAMASGVDVAVVDVTVPTDSVTLAPGASGNITINMSVTGNQAGTATFEVYRDWTLSGGTFTGSNPQEFTVDSRSPSDPADTFSTSGTVTVAAGQDEGTFTLTVGAFDITNSNATGAKLAAGDPSNYQVTVSAPPPPSDTTPPVLTPNILGTLGDNGWYVSDVYVSWTVVDNESSISSTSGCGITPINFDTAGTTSTCTATSVGGTSTQSVTIMRDATTPTISGSVSPAPNGAGWNNTDVTVSFTCDDNLSGVASCGPDQTLNTDGDAQSVTGTAVDNAGNSASLTRGGINIDKIAPVVEVVGVANGATYTLGSVPAAGCSSMDALSGLVTAPTLNVNGGPVGSVTATCSGALDNAGNSGSASVTYNVIYDWNGFFQPIDNGALNVAKGGSAIPVKFSLSGDQGLNIFAVGYPKSQKIACDTNALEDVIEVTVTAGGSSLSYDVLADQYVYVWKTEKSWAGTCRQLQVKLDDGTTHTANFKFK